LEETPQQMIQIQNLKKSFGLQELLIGKKAWWGARAKKCRVFPAQGKCSPMWKNNAAI